MFSEENTFFKPNPFVNISLFLTIFDFFFFHKTTAELTTFMEK